MQLSKLPRRLAVGGVGGVGGSGFSEPSSTSLWLCLKELIMLSLSHFPHLYNRVIIEVCCEDEIYNTVLSTVPGTERALTCVYKPLGQSPTSVLRHVYS